MPDFNLEEKVQCIADIYLFVSIDVTDQVSYIIGLFYCQ